MPAPHKICRRKVAVAGEKAGEAIRLAGETVGGAATCNPVMVMRFLPPVARSCA